jgi:stage V sporulation protein AF
MAIRLLSIILLSLVGLGGAAGLPWVGFGVGMATFVLLAVNLRSLTMGYTWPLLPFDAKGLVAVLARKPLNRDLERPSLTLPQDRRRQPS